MNKISTTVINTFDPDTDKDLFDQYAAMALLLSLVHSDDNKKVKELMHKGQKWRITFELLDD